MTTGSLLVGESAAVERLRKEIPKIGNSAQNVLLEGARGVGKTLVAQLVHDATKGKKELVLFNHLNITSEALEELSSGMRKNVSTAVFQEVEDFSALYQAQLAKLASGPSSKYSLRVIVTIRGSYDELRKQGQIFGELSHSLRNFKQLSIPSLGDRPEDIPHLVRHFIKTACERMGVEMKAIDVNTLDFLVRRNWKENARELRSVIESAVMSSQGAVAELPRDLVDEYSQLDGILARIQDGKAFSFDESLENLEKTLIQRVLNLVGFRQQRAAEILNISDANLRYRMRKYRIFMPGKAPDTN